MSCILGNFREEGSIKIVAAKFEVALSTLAWLKYSVLTLATVGLVLLGTRQAAQAQTENVLFPFNGTTDGYSPVAGVVFGKGKILYGTTTYGGTVNAACPAGCGVVFSLKLSKGVWKEKAIYNFQGGSDGAFPYGTLAVDKSGNLYGTTLEGGAHNGGIGGAGTVYRVTPAGGETVLYSFAAYVNDGDGPFAGVVLDKEGNIYGTTISGGTSSNCSGGCGTAFELAQGTWAETILYNFPGGTTGGCSSRTPLLFDKKGNLYGTNQACGPNGGGAAFELEAADSWNYQILHAFSDASGSTDGDEPWGNLAFDKKGNLYGTTTAGGTIGSGTVYKLTPPSKNQTNWTEQVIYNFGSVTDDALIPAGGVTINTKTGNLYGTSMLGGTGGAGTVFELTPPSATETEWTEQVLHSFSGFTTDGDNPDYSPITLDSAGDLYGTTIAGGSSTNAGYGTVFEVIP